MPTRLRKVRRMRGSRTLGYGQVGQHRHSGQQGGHGNAGLHKHKWTWTVKYAPDHFGRDPFRPPTSSKPKRWLNVGELDLIYSSIKGDGKLIDLQSMGFEKLLGTGKVSGAYEVKIKSFTKRAKDKIEAAGGRIIQAE